VSRQCASHIERGSQRVSATIYSPRKCRRYRGSTRSSESRTNRSAT
jgi:hypothetical protein